MRAAPFVALIALACASAPPTIEGPAPTLAPPPSSAVPTAESDRPPPGKLYREDVVRVVELGFPQFLQKVEVSAEVSDGKFTGWLVRALYPRDFWAGVDLAPGDVVTQINGLPVERETQAYDAFEALKTAPRLVVSFVREGVPHTLAFDIVPAAAATQPAPQPQPVSSNAPAHSAK